MGRRSAQAEENHWPGFVDALSTIVMVVTFLLIILAIVIFVLSQNVAKTYIESLSQQTNGGGDVFNPNPQTASKDFQSEKQVEVPDPDAAPIVSSAGEEFESDAENSSKTETQTAGEGTGVGDFKTDQAKKAQSDIPEISAKEIEAPSLKVTEEEETVRIVPEEEPETPQTEVIQAATVLTLAFDPTSTKISEDASDAIQTFVDGNQNVLSEANVNVISFANVDSNSISQARRIAYYRALAARNELIRGGFPTDSINVEIRLSKSSERADTVEIIVEP